MPCLTTSETFYADLNQNIATRRTLVTLIGSVRFCYRKNSPDIPTINFQILLSPQDIKKSLFMKICLVN